jgi:hypothetical protein
MVTKAIHSSELSIDVANEAIKEGRNLIENPPYFVAYSG